MAPAEKSPHESIPSHNPVAIQPVTPGLTAQSGLEAELDTLVTLEAILAPHVFWNPETQSGVPCKAMEAYLDRVVGLEIADRAKLDCFRSLRGLPAWSRIVKANRLMNGVPPSLRLPLAYAAELPYGLVSGIGGGLHGESIDCRRSGQDTAHKISWLPSGLEITGDLNLSATDIKTLPEGLRVRGILNGSLTKIAAIPAGIGMEELKIGGCGLITHLPEDLDLINLDIRATGIAELPRSLKVERRFEITNTPLAQLSDEEIRAMAPGISGKIVR